MRSSQKLTRRRFLQTAVLGVGAVVFHRPLLNTVSPEVDENEFEVYSGILENVGSNWVDIRENNGMRRLRFDSASEFWKGEPIAPSALIPGDEAVIRARLTDDVILKSWVNLTRAIGQVIKKSKNEFVVQSLNPSSAKEFLVRTHSETRFGNPDLDYLPQKRDFQSIVQPMDLVDIIGLSIPEGILASTFIHHPVSANLLANRIGKTKIQPLTTISADGILTTWQYTGHANWFDCPTGGGGCGGSCSTSNSNQCAYPAIDINGCRGSCGGSCCDCTSSCYTMVFKSCQNEITVSDRCYTRTRKVTIVDCGPNVNVWCNQGCGAPNCSNLTPPIVDLTKPTFTVFRDPAAGWGCFSCDTIVTV